MKKAYKEAEVHWITFALEDVITTSGAKEPTGPNELEPDLEGIF